MNNDNIKKIKMAGINLGSRANKIELIEVLSAIYDFEVVTGFVKWGNICNGYLARLINVALDCEAAVIDSQYHVNFSKDIIEAVGCGNTTTKEKENNIEFNKAYGLILTVRPGSAVSHGINLRFRHVKWGYFSLLKLTNGSYKWQIAHNRGVIGNEAKTIYEARCQLLRFIFENRYNSDPVRIQVDVLSRNWLK